MNPRTTGYLDAIRMKPRRRPAGLAGLIVAAALSAGFAHAQTMYKVVTPDGKVFYTDKPPASGAVSVEPMQLPGSRVMPPGLPAGSTSVPAMPGRRGDTQVPLVQGPPPRTLGALLSTQEMGDVRECTRTHRSELALIKASEEVLRAANNVRTANSNVASTYWKDMLERQWKEYKSLGGTAASPEAVRVPEDPCLPAREVLQKKSVSMEAQYQECAASHGREMRLSALSKELAGGMGYLRAVERLREEKRNNPGIDSTKGSGEYARALQADPLVVRAGLAIKFQEYRSAGGPATRLEDVREIPDPCLPAPTEAAKSTPLIQKRTMSLPREWGLFAPGELAATFAGRELLLDEASEYPAPQGTRKLSSTVIARHPARPVESP